MKDIKKINQVIKSYKNLLKKIKNFSTKNDSEINCSGVVFNKDLNTAVNYYVINYDDISCKSDK